MKKVLYLSYDGMTDPLGQSQVLPYLSELSKEGYEIHLISFEKPNRWKAQKEIIEEIALKKNIRWYPVTYTKSPPVLSTIYDLFRLKRKIAGLLKSMGFSIIHCRSQLTAMVAMKFRKEYNLKMIFDMRGFWPDERLEGKIWNPTNPLYRFIYSYLKREEKKLFRNSDAVISLTHKALPLIHEIQGEKINDQLISVIPCCADTAFFDPLIISEKIKNETREKLNIPQNSFVLSYLGAIGTWYLPEEMLGFFKRLLIKFPDAFFLFITPEKKEIIYELAIKNEVPLDRIVVISALRSEVPALISISNASIFFIKPTFSKQASSPTKQGELMSMGVPVICNKGIGDTDSILQESKSGYVCVEMNDESYDMVINRLNREIPEAERNRIRNAAINYFSLEEGVRRYKEIYDTLS